MKLEIIETGVIVDDEKLELGKFIEIDGDSVPPSLINKVRERGGERTFVTNPASVSEATGPVGELIASDTGGGWWTIADTAGTPFGKKLRADDAKEFNAMSAEDRAAFVAE